MSPEVRINDTHIIKQMGRIVACLNSSQNTHELVEQIHQVIKELLYADNFYVVLLNEDGALQFPYYVDSIDKFTEETLNSMSLEDIQSTMTFFALTSNVPCNFTSQDIEKLEKENIVKVLGTAPKQWLSFPLVMDETSLGAFIIQSYRNEQEYREREIELLLAISHVVSSAMSAYRSKEALSYANISLKAYQTKLEDLIRVRTEIIEQKKKSLEEEVHQRALLQETLEQKVAELEQQMKQNLELREQLQHQAHHDHLTGLANRHELNNVLNRMSAKMLRVPRFIYMLFIDLDGFKQVNDTLGHDAGDAVLVEVSKRLQKAVRGYDLIARIGGDEFVVLIESMEENRFVEHIAQRIIDDLQKPIDVGAEHTANIGASVGLACSLRQDQLGDLITRADQAMYQAKHQGKGRFTWDK